MAVFQQYAKFEEKMERDLFQKSVHDNPLNSMCLMYSIMSMLNPSDLQQLKSTSSVFEKHISSISETSIIDRRIGALSGTRVTEIKEDHISEDKFIEILHKTQLDNSVVVFLRELLKLKKNGNNVFYIGGSTALMFASFVHNIEIDISLYDESDNDIYVIGDIEIEEAQELLKMTIQKYLPEDFSYMYIKTHFTNMVPKEEGAKVSQFVHHIKEDMGKHFEFVDLPITQFLVGDGILYGTIFAHYALQTGINILGGKINDAVVNRIMKYIDRGYHFVNIGDQPIGLLRDLSLKITHVYVHNLLKYTDLHEYKVDTNLRDFEFMLKADRNVIDRYDFDKKYPKPSAVRPSLKISAIYGPDKISRHRMTYRNDITEVVSTNNSYSNIFRLMEQMDIIDKSVNSRIVTKVTTERRRIYRDDMFGGSHLYSGDNYDYIINDIIEVRNIIETKFKVNRQKQYKYKDDERNHNIYRYEKWLRSERENNNKPFYQVLTIHQFCSIPNLIFFKEFTSYFLNKNNCKMGIDGNYYPMTSEIPEKKINFYCRTLQEPKITSDDDGFTLVTKKRH